MKRIMMLGYPAAGEEHSKLLHRFSAGRSECTAVDTANFLTGYVGMTGVSKACHYVRDLTRLKRRYALVNDLTAAFIRSYRQRSSVQVRVNFITFFPFTSYDPDGTPVPASEIVFNADNLKLFKQMIEIAVNSDGEIHPYDAALLSEFEMSHNINDLSYTDADRLSFENIFKAILQYRQALLLYLVELNYFSADPSGEPRSCSEADSLYRASELHSQINKYFLDNPVSSVLPVFCTSRRFRRKSFSEHCNRLNAANRYSTLFQQRMLHAMRYYHARGFYMLFGANTFRGGTGKLLTDSNGKYTGEQTGDIGIDEFRRNPVKYNTEFFNDMSYICVSAYYKRELGKILTRPAFNKMKRSDIPDVFAYMRVAEYGDKNGRLHFHYIIFTKCLPLGTVDPNRGLPFNKCVNVKVKSFSGYWRFGDTYLSYAKAFRYSGDAFSRAGWRSLCNPDGSAKPLTSMEAGVNYLSQYLTSSKSRKRSGSSERFLVSMSRHLINLHIDFSDVSEKILIELSRIHHTASDYSHTLNKLAREELARRCINEDRFSIDGIVSSIPHRQNFILYQNYLYSDEHYWVSDEPLRDISDYINYFSLISQNPLVSKLRNIGMHPEHLFKRVRDIIPYIIPYYSDAVRTFYRPQSSVNAEDDLVLSFNQALSPISNKIGQPSCNNDIFIARLPYTVARIIVNYHSAIAFNTVPALSVETLMFLSKYRLGVSTPARRNSFAGK